MNIRKTINSLINKNYLIEIRRDSLSDETIIGFVISCSKNFILLNTIDDNFNKTGWNIVKIEDITHYRIFDSPKHLLYLVINELSLTPEFVSIQLESYKSIFKSLYSSAPIIGIYCEKKDDFINIGKILKIKDKSVEILEIDEDGEWDKIYRYSFSDITRIEWGNGYQNALWKLAEKSNIPQ